MTAKKEIDRNDAYPAWQVWIDTGGTFTDCLAFDRRGRLHREKVLSSSALRGTIKEMTGRRELRVDVKWKAPGDFIRGFQFCLLEKDGYTDRVERFDPSARTIVLSKPLPDGIAAGAVFEVHSPEEAPLLAARLVTGTPLDGALPGMHMRLATTRGTNALLERTGVPIALFITKGYQDLLRIGNQQRPELFTLHIRKPRPLYRAVVEVPERTAADGGILESLKLDGMDRTIRRLIGEGIRGAAIVLIHSYMNPAHEHRLAGFLLERGFNHVSCSSDLAPFIKIVPRGETAVVDAYLAPIIEDYFSGVQEPLTDGRLHVLTSAGGLVQPGAFHAKDSLLSGPAGGVVGAATAGRRSGFSKVIAFDMGGTSTDVARFDGDYEYVFEYEVGDAHLVAPALALESVAAGGGSICSFDGYELRVGPESAGAQPGPACYGAGGPLTLTDVNLLLGRLDTSRFEIPIEREAAERGLEIILRRIEERRGDRPPGEKLLEGFCDIANERMADAIRRISIRKGYDQREYALVAFGGAGGQHACAVAELLRIETIVIPQDAGLLSALGLGYASVERFVERQVLEELHAIEGEIPGWLQELGEEASAALECEGIVKDEIEIRRRIVNMRFTGQEAVLQVDVDEAVPLGKSFETQYRSIFGHWQEGCAVEVESIRVVASSRPVMRVEGATEAHPCYPAAQRRTRAYMNGGWYTMPVFDRAALSPGAKMQGPALVSEAHSMTVVESGWSAEVDRAGSLVLTRSGVIAGKPARSHLDLVQLELFANRFRAVTQEMGEMFRRTAMSTNVKERLDFSCALLDTKGELVVNAPHIPVHLGAIGLCVREMLEAVPIGEGDVVVTNHPRFGGSHVPDVTVVSPVCAPGSRILGYVANRAHHAEIGGTRPGSMPPMATTLAEEGVVIQPTLLYRCGEPHWDEMRRILVEAPLPSRAVEENMADLRAAVAANRRGVRALQQLVEAHGEEAVRHYMEALKKRAEAKIREALRRMPDGEYRARERLDDGSPLWVHISISGDHATIDFAGSAPVHPGNLNATPAVVTSAVIYVLRLMVDEPLPLNEGLLRAVSLSIPRGILNPPFGEDPSRAPAVVGGNVETSQRLVDTLLKALQLAACSQGTMNNVLFGTDRFSYYETVCGGCGAGPRFDGASAVHSHMTNTRITDPEIIERRYPVRVERFAVREGSGGHGRHRGGDGAVREISFLEPMSLSVLGQHRKEGPYGLQGGEPGKPAKQYILRSSGERYELDSVDECEVHPGDRLILETPGGGGFGERGSGADR